MINADTTLKVNSMPCFVYKGELRDDHFLFLPCPLEELMLDHDGGENDTQETQAVKGDLADQPEYRTLPAALLKRLGHLAFVTEFILHAERRMPQADPLNVMADFKKQGFYLQMPKTSVNELEDQYFS